MPQPRTEELPTPTPALPESCSGPLLSGSPSTPQASGLLQLAQHALSAAIALFALRTVLSWFPTCLGMVRLPGGGVTHDLWSWAPIALDVVAVIGIAAPVSLKNLLEFARVLKLPFRA